MIDLDRIDEWIQICYVTEKNDLCFTREYLNLTKELGWDARRFAAHLIAHWEPKYQHVLDYFGPEDADEDWYSGINGEAMDVGELVAETLEVEKMPYEGLPSDWYRDVMRAKLATIKLPASLIETYVKTIKTIRGKK